MFDWLNDGLGFILSWFSSWSNYAVALLFYALIFKVLFLFFAVKQQKNQIAMAKLAPRIELIKAKYKGRNDQATLRKQQEEIMELQQKEGYSALSGCLPLLIQLPIIIFLYNVIRNPLSHIANFSDELIGKIKTTLEFTADDQILLASKIKEIWIAGGTEKLNLEMAGLTEDLYQAIPRFDIFGIDLGFAPGWHGFTVASLVLLIPFIAAGLQWFTMWISRKLNGNSMAAPVAEENSQTKLSMGIMDLIMPLMTLWLTFSFSAVMGLYWIYQSVFTIIQTVILSKVMPIPKYTEEELKAIRKAQKEAEKAQKKIIKSQPKYKSLHYIDEDDYDELPEVKSAPATGSEKKPLTQEKPEIKD